MALCIFCSIAQKKAPAFLIHEDNTHMAFMDLFPPTFNGKITMPTVLVITKKHLGSDVFEDVSDQEYADLMRYIRMIAKATRRGLKPRRVCMVFEGMEIDHLHAKLYPIFLDSYPGYLSTEKSLGNKDVRASDAVLKAYVKNIQSAL
jgi:histidine triad (HIT) family protein